MQAVADKWRPAGLALLACVWIQPVAAGDVYRCEQGRTTTYQQEPCAGGARVEAADPRTAQQRRESREQLTREVRVAEKLARDRARDERAPSGHTGMIGRPARMEADGAWPKPQRPVKARKRHLAADATGEQGAVHDSPPTPTSSKATAASGTKRNERPRAK